MTTSQKMAEATPYIGISGALTLVISYFTNIPAEVSGAITVLLMAGINYGLIILKPIVTKLVEKID